MLVGRLAGPAVQLVVDSSIGSTVVVVGAVGPVEPLAALVEPVGLPAVHSVGPVGPPVVLAGRLAVHFVVAHTVAAEVFAGIAGAVACLELVAGSVVRSILVIPDSRFAVVVIVS